MRIRFKTSAKVRRNLQNAKQSSQNIAKTFAFFYFRSLGLHRFVVNNDFDFRNTALVKLHYFKGEIMIFQFLMDSRKIALQFKHQTG